MAQPCALNHLALQLARAFRPIHTRETPGRNPIARRRRPLQGRLRFFCSLPRCYCYQAVLLLIDNYDSFTYNLVQLIGTVAPSLDIRVFRNDKITVDQAESLKPTHIVISPGPCTPTEGGVSNDMI